MVVNLISEYGHYGQDKGYGGISKDISEQALNSFHLRT